MANTKGFSNKQKEKIRIRQPENSGRNPNSGSPLPSLDVESTPPQAFLPEVHAATAIAAEPREEHRFPGNEGNHASERRANADEATLPEATAAEPQQPDNLDPITDTLNRIKKAHWLLDLLFTVVYWGHWSKVNALKSAKEKPNDSAAQKLGQQALNKLRFMPFFSCCRTPESAKPSNKNGNARQTPAV